MAKNIGTLDKYDQRKLWKCICIVNPLDIFFKSQKSNHSLDDKNLKWGEISLWNKSFFLKYTLDIIIGTPRKFLREKYLWSIFPFIFTILSTLWWLWTWNYPAMASSFTEIYRRKNKAQIPLIIHHNEKNQRIYFWCAAKDNWASQISEVALRKELEQWKSPFPPSGQ